MTKQQVIFDEDQKKVLSEELEKLIQDYLDYLQDNDSDEDTRSNRLYPLMYLKRIVDLNMIDRLNITEEDFEQILSDM